MDGDDNDSAGYHCRGCEQPINEADGHADNEPDLCDECYDRITSAGTDPGSLDADAGMVERERRELVPTIDSTIRVYRATYEECSPDPWLRDGAPHSETVEAFARLIQYAAEVSKRRPEAYANEPWLGISVEEHLRHAEVHARMAQGPDPIDDDGLPHTWHAITRLAFAAYLEDSKR